MASLGEPAVRPTERRKTPRYGFQADVEIEWGSDHPRAMITDLGLGGMFIATEEPLWVGAKFSARLLLQEPLQVNCAVRRVVPSRGMGVAFEDLAAESKARLETLVNWLAG